MTNQVTLLAGCETMYKPTEFEKRAAKEREMIFEAFLKEGLTISILRKLKSLAINTVKNSPPNLQCINIRAVFESVLGSAFLLCSGVGKIVSSKITGEAKGVCDYRALECLLFTLISSTKKQKEIKINVKLENRKATVTLNSGVQVSKELLSAASSTVFLKESSNNCRTVVVIRFLPESGETIKTDSEIDYLADPLSYAYIYLCDICLNPLTRAEIKV